MHGFPTLLIAAILGSIADAQAGNLHGKISNHAGTAIAKAVVTLSPEGLTDTSGTDGSYSINTNSISISPARGSNAKSVFIENGILQISAETALPVKVEVFDTKGVRLHSESFQNTSTGINRLDLGKTYRGTALLLIEISANHRVTTFQYVRMDGHNGSNSSVGRLNQFGGGSARLAAVPDTLKVSATGYTAKSIVLGSLDTTLNITLDTLDNSTGPDTSNRMIVLRDSAIAESAWNYRFLWTWADNVTKAMSTDSSVGNKYLGSIFSTTNSTAQALSFPGIGNDLEYDSIVGVEFYLLAKASAKTNFVAFLSKETGKHGPAYYLGIGFDKSDSIKILWNDTIDVAAPQENKNIAPIHFGKWHKCTIEYNVTNRMATYYIDDKVVGKHDMPTASAIGFSYSMFVVYRDALGQNGPAPYYFNDFIMYKIQKKS